MALICNLVDALRKEGVGKQTNTKTLEGNFS